MLLTKSKIYELRIIVPEISSSYNRKLFLFQEHKTSAVDSFRSAIFRNDNVLRDYYYKILRETKNMARHGYLLSEICNCYPEQIDYILDFCRYHNISSSLHHCKRLSVLQYLITFINIFFKEEYTDIFLHVLRSSINFKNYSLTKYVCKQIGDLSIFIFDSNGEITTIEEYMKARGIKVKL